MGFLLNKFRSKNSGVFLIFLSSTIFSKAIPFVLQPILSRVLTPEDYGYIDIYNTIAGLITPLVILGTTASVNREYFRTTEEEYSKIMTNILIVSTLSSIALNIVFFGVFPFIANLVHLSIMWFVTIPTFILFQSVIQFNLTFWQVSKKPKPYALVEVSRTLLEFVGVLLLLFCLSKSWESRILGRVFSFIIYGSICFFILKKNKLVRGSFDLKVIRSTLKYSLPVIPHAIGGFLLNSIDRLFIVSMLGMGELGLYSAGYQFGMIIGFIQDAFNKVWQPWLFESLSKNQDSNELKNEIVSTSVKYIVFLLALALAVGILAPLIFRFYLGEKFQSSSIFVIWVALGYAFNGIYKLFVGFLFYFNRTSLLPGITLSGAVLNMALNYLFIKEFGAIGAAYSTAAAFLFLLIITAIVSNRAYPLPWFELRLWFGRK